MKSLANCSAVVTGAGGGIGRSIALALGEAGVNVVVSDIESAAADTVADEVRRIGVESLAVPADVSKLDQVEALAEAAYGKFGSIDVLVNNAGVTLRPFRASWDTSYQDIQWLMNINFWGVFHGHHIFIPRMRNTPGEKHIVNTSSMASVISIAGHSAYSASKGAVDGFSNAAREELKTQNIGLTLLLPGPIRTRIVSSERLRSEKEASFSRSVTPWSDYIDKVSNPIIDKPPSEKEESEDPDFASNPLEYIKPDAVGGMVVNAIRENQPYVLTHPAPEEAILDRAKAIIAGGQNKS